MATQNTRAEFRKKLLHLMIPISLQQLMMALVNASDAFMLGFVNQDALSAVSLAGQVQFVYSLFLFAITAGVSIFAAQYWGIQNKKAVEKTLGIGLAFSVLLSLPFTIGATFFPELLMRAFASDPVLIQDGAVYLRVVGVSYLPQHFADLPVHSEKLRKSRTERCHQFRFRHHQHHSECRFHLRHRFLSGNGHRRRCRCNGYRKGDRTGMGACSDAEKGQHQDPPWLDHPPGQSTAP